MKRLSVLLDDLAVIRSVLSDDKIDPVRFGILAESAGANGLVCTYSGSAKGILERDLRLIKEMNRSFFNLRMPIQTETMRLALSIIPDMVTFVDIKATDPRKVNPLNPDSLQEDLEQILPNLQANNIASSILVRPEIDSLKAISKLSVDYVEIDVSEYTHSGDINEEIVALDKIKSAALAVGKWGIGVNCSGNIALDDIPALAQTPNLEDITLGANLIQRALLVGVQQAVREAQELIRYREVD
jgi:pyridoxine 5-phosphate synthase